jgi:hypothetical protein
LDSDNSSVFLTTVSSWILVFRLTAAILNENCNCLTIVPRSVHS